MRLLQWSNPARRADALDRLARVVDAAPVIDERLLQISSPLRETLSRRELDALRCVSHGMTAPQAAEALGLELVTVCNHLRAARYRLRAKNTTHAVALAIRTELLA